MFFFLSHKIVGSSATQGLTVVIPSELVGVAQSNSWVLFWKCHSICRHSSPDGTNPMAPPEPSPRDSHYQPGVYQREEGERELHKDCKSKGMAVRALQTLLPAESPGKTRNRRGQEDKSTSQDNARPLPLGGHCSAVPKSRRRT